MKCNLPSSHIYTHVREYHIHTQKRLPYTLVIRRTLLLGAYYLLGTWFLRGTWHHLLSACVLNRVHNGGKRLSENHGIKNTQHTQWSSWSQRKKSYTGFFCFWLTQSHKPHPLQLITGLLGLVKFLQYMYNAYNPAYLLEYTMAANHGLRMEPSDFTSYLPGERV